MFMEQWIYNTPDECTKKKKGLWQEKKNGQHANIFRKVSYRNIISQPVYIPKR